MRFRPEQEITSRLLHDLPLGFVVASLMTAKGAQADIDALFGEIPAYRPEPRLRPGPKGWPIEHYRKVAERIRAAYKRYPRSPIESLAREWPTSAATLRRWRAECERLGLLKPRQKLRKKRT
jgi:hypothetical protein